MSLTLAIDLGTGSCRAIVFSEDGDEVASSQREWTHPTSPSVPGSRNFDTSANWRLICECVREAIHLSGHQPPEIARISTSSMREGMVLYDAQGREIWACPNVDSRAGEEATRLVASGAARQLFERGGDWVAITSPSRFLWLRDHEPEIFRSIAHMGMLSDWAIKRLTGLFVTEPSIGSSSNLFDLATRSWSESSLEVAGLRIEMMPEVVDAGTVVGPLTQAAAEETGLAVGTPVVMGGADTQLALVGNASSRADAMTLVGGSFWQLTVLSDHPLIDPEARVRTLCHATPDLWMTEGIGFYCGIVMRWLRDTFSHRERDEAVRRGINPYVVMEEGASQVPPGSNGLLAIFSSVMDVKRWVQASPSFIGFDVDDPSRTDNRACIRAVEEQAAYASKGHLDIIEQLTRRPYPEIVFTGGASRGVLWPQIVADVMNVAVKVPVVKESTALGAALFAGVGTGLYRDIQEAAMQVARIERTFEPDPAAHSAYTEHYARWRKVYAEVLELAEDGYVRPMWWPAGA